LLQPGLLEGRVLDLQLAASEAALEGVPAARAKQQPFARDGVGAGVGRVLALGLCIVERAHVASRNGGQAVAAVETAVAGQQVEPCGDLPAAAARGAADIQHVAARAGEEKPFDAAASLAFGNDGNGLCGADPERVEHAGQRRPIALVGLRPVRVVIDEGDRAGRMDGDTQPVAHDAEAVFDELRVHRRLGAVSTGLV
jgi:hypothetical protein